MGVKTLRGHLDFRGGPRPRARGLPRVPEVFAQTLKSVISCGTLHRGDGAVKGIFAATCR